MEEREIKKESLRKRAIQFLIQLLPIISWIKNYNIKENLKGDILAGLTVGLFVIPQAMVLKSEFTKLSIRGMQLLQD